MARVIVSNDVPTRFAALIHDALERDTLVALSGGSTILALLDALGPSLPRTGTIAQVDERLVEPGSPEANWTHLGPVLSGRGPALLPMVDADALTPADLATLATEDPATVPKLADRLAARYGTQLESRPTWGLVHLGIGADGHTASLFPGSPGLDASGLVTPNHDPSGHNRHWRLSLTRDALARFETQVIVALGAPKATIVAAALGGADLPVVHVTRDDTIWLLDPAAASALDPSIVSHDG